MPLWPLGIVGGTSQKVTATASSAKLTNAFYTQTRAIMLTAETANVRVEIGPNPTASASSLLVKTSDPPLIIGIGAGDTVAVIQDSSGGVLTVVEMTYY